MSDNSGWKEAPGSYFSKGAVAAARPTKIPGSLKYAEYFLVSKLFMAWVVDPFRSTVPASGNAMV